MTNLEQEVEFVHQLLKHPAGYDVGCGGYLSIRRYEHPVWIIEFYEEGADIPSFTKEFDSPLEAAKIFVTMRHELELGLDFLEQALKNLEN